MQARECATRQGPTRPRTKSAAVAPKLRGSCSREMAKTRPLTRKTNTQQVLSSLARTFAGKMHGKNLCKTVEISCTWFTVLVQGKLMQVAQTSHGPHYATSPQELALPLSGTAPKLSYTTNTARPKNLSTHGSLSQSHILFIPVVRASTARGHSKETLKACSN